MKKLQNHLVVKRNWFWALITRNKWRMACNKNIHLCDTGRGGDFIDNHGKIHHYSTITSNEKLGTNTIADVTCKNCRKTFAFYDEQNKMYDRQDEKNV